MQTTKSFQFSFPVVKTSYRINPNREADHQLFIPARVDHIEDMEIHYQGTDNHTSILEDGRYTAVITKVMRDDLDILPVLQGDLFEDAMKAIQEAADNDVANQFEDMYAGMAYFHNEEYD